MRIFNKFIIRVGIVVGNINCITDSFDSTIELMKFNDFDFFKSLKGLLCFICGKLKGESCQKKEKKLKITKQTTKYHKYNYDLFIIKMLQNLDKNIQ